MIGNFTVSLSNVMKELNLDIIFMPNDPDKVLISSKDVSRLGLELTGFLNYFDSNRLLILGNTEISFLSEFTSEKRYETIENIFLRKPPAVIISKDIDLHKEIVKSARQNNIPILKSKETTSALIGHVVSYMNLELAPRITRHGVLMEVYGEGVFIIGDSGVGKSESAIELIKRGHRLISDDSVEIRRINDNSLVGSAPENVRHFVELRGIGIINARHLFGISSVKMTQDIDIVINLEPWDDTKIYDRMGMTSEYTKILNIEMPVVTIPVKPGRNLAVIIEVAAMNNRQKKMGYNAAQELFNNLGIEYQQEDIVSRNQIKFDF